MEIDHNGDPSSTYVDVTVEGENDVFCETEGGDDRLYVGDSKPAFEFAGLTLDQLMRLKASQERRKQESIVNGVAGGEGGIYFGMDDTLNGTKPKTPVYLLRLLSNAGKLIEMEAKELELGDGKLRDFRARRWRVEWTHNGLKGIGEAPRKMMATQVAAYDLVLKLQVQHPEYNLPDPIIPPGCLINPFLFKLVDDSCEKNGLALPEFQLKLNLDEKGRKEFTALCFVGDEIFIGISYDPFYAKRFAVKKAYEVYTDSLHPDDKIFRGEADCGKGGKYNEIESEASHVYCLYNKTNRKASLHASEVNSSGPPSVAGSMKQVNILPSLLPPRLRPPPVSIPEGLNLDLKAIPNPRAHRFRSKKPRPSSPDDKSFLTGTMHKSILDEDEVVSEEDLKNGNCALIESPLKYKELPDENDNEFGPYVITKPWALKWIK